MYKLTDAMLIEIFGQDYYNYGIQKSNELAGGAFYDVILAAILGKIKNQLNLTVGVAAVGG